ncbi:hypothetical protein Tco_1234078 [Tanacetum coccineum]
MNTVVYLNEARQAIMNIDDSSNGYERVNLDVTCTPNDEQTAPVVGDEGIKGSILTEINMGHLFFAKMVTHESSRKIANFRTLVTPKGNGDDVVVSKESILAIINSTREKIELRADVALKDTIVVDVPKHTGEGFSRCIVRVEYKWKLPRCSPCKRSSGWSEVKVSIKQVYQPVSKKNGANTSGKKEQVDLDRQEVINSNLFDAFNFIENDDDLSTNGGIQNDDGKPLKRLILWLIQIIIKKWKRETKVDGDYDPYDDDLYDGYDMSENLRAIYDYLDIKLLAM